MDQSSFYVGSSGGHIATFVGVSPIGGASPTSAPLPCACSKREAVGEFPHDEIDGETVFQSNTHPSRYIAGFPSDSGLWCAVELAHSLAGAQFYANQHPRWTIAHKGEILTRSSDTDDNESEAGWNG